MKGRNMTGKAAGKAPRNNLGVKVGRHMDTRTSRTGIAESTWLRAAGALVAAALCVLVGAAPAPADPPLPVQDWTRTEVRDDCASYSALRNPYFGDMHVHTKYSADAVLARTRNDPRDAYSFAQGGTVGLPDRKSVV